LVGLSLTSLLLWGLKPSIDFTGGTRLEISGTNSTDEISELIQDEGLENPQVQRVGENRVAVRIPQISEEKHRELSAKIKEKLGQETEIVNFETVGPTISRDITKKAIIAIVFAVAVIIIYIGYSFRRVPKPATSWEFGITSVLALIHDTIIVVGAFSLLGRIYGIEVDPLFITGLLTIISFSVHDTIVIFDRVRELIITRGSIDFEEMVDQSLLEMLPRTLVTSFLVWIVLLILFLFGGDSVRYFVLTMTIGVFVGTFSSLIVASPLLVTWQQFKSKGGFKIMLPKINLKSISLKKK
jgi:preprotein translocase subunit SecF